MIDYIIDLVKENYQELTKAISELSSPEEDAQKISMAEIERQILIRAIDTLWVEHIDAMDQTRRGIGLRGYGQRDPLVEYKKESFGLFQQLNNLIRKQVVYSIFKVADVGQFITPSIMQVAKQFSGPTDNASSFSGFKPNSASNTSTSGLNLAPQKAKDDEGNKVGRNDPCPCGSGKKYKKCHGK